MAEVFNNYLVSSKFSDANIHVTIVPQCSDNSSGRNSLPAHGETVVSAYGTRTVGATTQLHSIYITYAGVDSIVDDPETNGVVMSLSVVDNTNPNEPKEYFIAKAVNILPNSSFYVEKTITLQPEQSLMLTYHQKTSDTTQYLINTVCSGVDLT